MIKDYSIKMATAFFNSKAAVTLVTLMFISLSGYDIYDYFSKDAQAKPVMVKNKVEQKSDPLDLVSVKRLIREHEIEYH